MWALATAAVVVLGALQIAAGEEHRVLIQTSDQVYNITVAHDGTTSAGTLDLPANSSYVARRAAANEPEQVLHNLPGLVVYHLYTRLPYTADFSHGNA